jgi:hypothetical protein
LKVEADSLFSERQSYERQIKAGDAKLEAVTAELDTAKTDINNLNAQLQETVNAYEQKQKELHDTINQLRNELQTYALVSVSVCVCVCVAPFGLLLTVFIFVLTSDCIGLDWIELDWICCWAKTK